MKRLLNQHRIITLPIPIVDGWTMPERQVVSSYRYGYNGQETDKEWRGGQAISFRFRVSDPRLGRFLSVDPLAPSYPWYTPYQFAGNKPIRFIDLDGLEEANPQEFEETSAIMDIHAGVSANPFELTSKYNYSGVSPKFSTIDEKTVYLELANNMRDEGKLINQNQTWLCGIAACSYTFASMKPKAYTKVVLDLYYYGEAALNGRTLAKANEGMYQGQDENVLSNKIDYIFLGSVRNYNNGYFSDAYVPNNTTSGGTWPGEISGIMKDFGLSVDHKSIYQGENLNKFTEAISAEKYIIVLQNASTGVGSEKEGNKVSKPGTKIDGAAKRNDNLLGIHFIVIRDVFEINNGMVKFSYWDYGVTKLKEKEMSVKKFKQYVKSYWIVSNPDHE